MLGYVVRASLHGVGVFSEFVRCCWWIVSNGRMYTHASTCICIYVYYMYICILPGFCLPGCTHTKMHTHAHPTFRLFQIFLPCQFRRLFFSPSPNRWCEAGCSGQLCSSTSPSLRSAQGGGVQSSFGPAGWWSGLHLGTHHLFPGICADTNSAHAGKFARKLGILRKNKWQTYHFDFNNYHNQAQSSRWKSMA